MARGDGRARRQFVVAVIAGTALAATALVLWGVAPTVRLLPTAHEEFWAMSLLALLVDVPLFGLGHRDETHLRTTLSVCFTFGIFLLFGLGPAVVVQALGGLLTVIGQRQGLRAGVIFVSRLVCALAAAEIVVLLAIHRPILSPVGILTSTDILKLLPLVGAWFVVGFGVRLAVIAVAWRGGFAAAVRVMQGDLLATPTLLLLVAPVMTDVAGWWNVLVAIPLVVWNLRSRYELRRDAAALREPGTSTLNREGLLAEFDRFTIFDPVRPLNPRPVGVVLINVESTLDINRGLGRDLYSKVIVQVTRRLAEAFGTDRVGRLTGEGFVVLLPDLRPDDALRAATSAGGVLRPIVVEDIPFDVDPAVGVALSPEHGRDLDTLVARAQLALGEARRTGEVAAAYVPEAQDEAQRRAMILTDVHSALLDPGRHHEIAVVYQPQVALDTRTLAAAEALVRWTHPVWGPVSPDELIGAIEPTEVMHLLTMYMLDRVGRQIGVWNEQGRRLRVAVNVSVQDMREPTFPQEIADILDRYRIDHGQLTIEITERMFINEASRVVHAAEQISKLGVGLSLDDFGTGHASLEQLQILPLTEVKIDKTYVSGVTGTDSKRAIVTSVHQLATAMGLATVAEGVEDEPTASALAQLPGTIGQGWHFGRPVPADVFTHDWLSH